MCTCRISMLLSMFLYVWFASMRWFAKVNFVVECSTNIHVNHGSACGIIHNRVGFHKVCTRWVTKQIIQERKWNHVGICQPLLDRYANEGEAFLKWIVSGDDTWIHHFEPESKHQSMECKHPESPIKKKLSCQPSAGKVFWQPSLYSDIHKGQYCNSTWRRAH